jgi:hypothetical protein
MKATGIPISDKTVGIWRVELPGGHWLAHLFHNGGATSRPECNPETFWRGSQARRLAALPVHILVYRFRWDKDGGDERPWAICGLRPGTPDGEAIEKARQAQDRLMTYGLGGWELLRGERSAAEFFAALREMPGMTAAVEAS